MAGLMGQKELEAKIKQEGVTLDCLKRMIVNEIYDLLNSQYNPDVKVELLNRFIDALIKVDNVQWLNEETDLDVNKVVKTMLNKTLSRKNLI